MKLSSFLEKYVYLVLTLAMAVIYVIVPRTGIYDWGKEILYTQYIKESVFRLKSLPYYLWNNNGLGFFPVIRHSGLFIGYPETFLFSPWIIFLSFLEPILFLKLFYLVHLILAVIGILLLARMLKWDSVQLRVFSGLLLLSPLIIQHVAIGYSPWINLFLFPVLVYFLLHKNRIVSVIGSAMICALVILQGGIHVAVWFLGFIYFTKFWQVVFYKKMSEILDFLGVFILSGVLSFVRIYSSFLTFKDFWQPTFPGFGLRSFLSMALKLPLFFSSGIDDVEGYFEFYFDGVPYWDGGVYWGPFLVILFFLLIILLLKSIRKVAGLFHRDSLPILLSSLSLLILSSGSIYSSITGLISRLIGIPAIEGVEKYPFRFTMVAYYGLALWFASAGLSPIRDLKIFLEKTRKKGDFIWNSSVKSPLRQKGIRKIFAVIFCSQGIFLISWVTWGRSILLKEIRNAYEGNGYPLIETMMKNKDVISIDAYLNKAMILSNWLIYFMAVAMLVCVFGFLYFLLYKKFQNLTVSFFTWIQKNLLLGLEVLIIIPLLISSLSWMRVAIATPFSSFEKSLKIEPELKISSPEGADLNITHVSPGELIIQCNSPDKRACDFEIPVKNRDLLFMNIDPIPLNRINQPDSQVFRIESGQRYKFKIQMVSLNLSLIFTLMSWVVISGFLVWSLKKAH